MSSIIQGLITVNDVWIAQLAAGQTPAVDGYVANIGSVLIDPDNGYWHLKTGVADTAWTKVISEANLANITTVGTITSGIWNGSVVESLYGGSGIANGGTFTWGSHNIVFTTTGATSLTLPTSGTIATQQYITSQNFVQSINVSGDVSGIASVTAGSAAITLTLDTVNSNDYASNTFLKFAVNPKGLITSAQPIVSGDIISALGYTPVNVAGDTMSGTLDFQNIYKVTGLPLPTSDSDAANKAYVDAAITGMTWKNSVDTATTGPVALSDLIPGYLNDNHALQAGDRVLVKDQTNAAENGIYIVQVSGAPVRSADANSGAELVNAAVFVQFGDTNKNSAWVQTTPGPITIGVTNIVFIHFSGAGTYAAGVGISITGNVIAVKLGAGIAELPTGEVGVELFTPFTGALGYMDNTGLRVDSLLSLTTNSTLNLFLEGTTLTQSFAGLKVAADGITATEINVSAIGSGLTGGSGTPISVFTSGVTIGTNVLGQVIVKSSGAAGQVLVSDPVNGEAVWSAIDLTNSTNAVNGILGIINGGTGANTAIEALTNLLPTQVGQTGKYLRTNGTTAIWSTAVAGITGTTGEITITGTPSNPIISIASNYAGQNTITTLGNITTGTWNADIIAPGVGGTGVNTFGGQNTVLYTTSADNLAYVTPVASAVLITDSSAPVTAPVFSQTLPTVVQANISVLGTVVGGTLSDGARVLINAIDFALYDATRTNALTFDIANITSNVSLSVPDIATGTLVVKDGVVRGNLITTNNTPTTIATVAIAAGKAYNIVAEFVGRKPSTGDVNIYRRTYAVKAGSLLNTNSDVTFEQVAQCNVAATLVGSNFNIQVVGQAAVDWNWTAIVTYVAL